MPNVMCSAPQRPEYEYETCAKLWAEARERRDRARANHEAASAELNDAESAEQQTWRQLEAAAGRAVPEVSLSKPGWAAGAGSR